MNCNYIFFYLQKLQLGLIDAACKEFLSYILVIFIVDSTAKFLKLYVQVENSIFFSKN